MRLLAFTFPGNSTVTLPSYIPQGGLGNLEVYLQRFMMVFLFLGISFALIYIVWGGLQWTQSQGDKQKVSAARSKITWAIVGLIILFLSYFFVAAVGYLFKVDLLKLKF